MSFQSDHGLGALKALLLALVGFSGNVGLIFCKPNIDSGGKELSALVETFVKEANNRLFNANLSQ